MPLYQYKCNECSKEFEELRKMSEADREIECPSCGSKDVKRKLPTSVCGGLSGNTSHAFPDCAA